MLLDFGQSKISTCAECDIHDTLESDKLSLVLFIYLFIIR